MTTKNQKEHDHALLLRSRSLPKSTRAVVISYLVDDEINAFLTRACEAIGVYYTTDIDDVALQGADIFVSDQEDQPIAEILGHSVIPVIHIDLSRDVFKEFNPMKFEGNAFIYETQNPYQIFEKIIRALENMRYPGDKRTLLKNIESTKV